MCFIKLVFPACYCVVSCVCCPPCRYHWSVMFGSFHPIGSFGIKFSFCCINFSTACLVYVFLISHNSQNEFWYSQRNMTAPVAIVRGEILSRIWILHWKSYAVLPYCSLLSCSSCMVCESSELLTETVIDLLPTTTAQQQRWPRNVRRISHVFLY